MKLSVKRIISEAEGMMSGHNAYMAIKFANISIMAEPEALLSVTVNLSEEGEKDIEEVADIAMLDEYQFIFVPKQGSYVFPICKALALSHPEYKIERKVYNGDDQDESADLSSLLTDEVDDADVDDLVICCKMPEMNKERRDISYDLVKTCYDEAVASIDAEYAEYKIALGEHVAKYDPTEADEAKDKLEETYKNQKDQCSKYKKEKDEQIEKAYQEYLKKKAEEEKAQEEMQEAKGKQAAKSMSLESLLNPEE